MKHSVTFNEERQRYEIVLFYQEKNAYTAHFLPLKSLNDPKTGRWMLEQLLNRSENYAPLSDT